MTQIKIQTYMERHKLGPLFEDLMNRLLRDMPEEPIVYLLRCLYKKGGMEIPQDVRYGGLRKSVDLGRSRSPEKGAKAEHATASTSIDGPPPAGRGYDKPWLIHSRHPKPRQSSEPDSTKTSKKSKLEGQGDTRMVTSFDELYEDQDVKKESSPGIRKSRAWADTHSSWAPAGHRDDNEIYTNSNYRRHQQNEISEEDLLAAETVRPSIRDMDSSQSNDVSSASVPRRKQKLELEQHRQQLQQALHSGDSPGLDIPDIANQDDNDLDENEDKQAIELLENADDLRNEGVKNIPSTGYKLSKILRERLNEPLVKLNIKLSPRTAVEYSKAMEKVLAKGYEADQENTSPGGQLDSEDEEFESVSQVTGPRRPVWEVPESDGDSSSPNATWPQARHEKPRHSKRLASTTPVKFRGIPLNSISANQRELGSMGSRARATGRRGEQLGGSPEGAQELESSPEQVEEGSLSTRSGGWVVPEDSDAASMHDWNQRVKGKKRDPRAY